MMMMTVMSHDGNALPPSWQGQIHMKIQKTLRNSTQFWQPRSRGWLSSNFQLDSEPSLESVDGCTQLTLELRTRMMKMAR